MRLQLNISETGRSDGCASSCGTPVSVPLQHYRLQGAGGINSYERAVGIVLHEKLGFVPGELLMKRLGHEVRIMRKELN